MSTISISLAQMTSHFLASVSDPDLLLKGLIVAYLIVSVAMAVIVIICLCSSPGTATADEGTAIFVIIAALLWPLWLLIYLIAKSCGPQKRPAAATPQAVKAKQPVAFGFPVMIKSTDSSRCTECFHTFVANEPRYVFRGESVCGKCREALVVLDA